MTPAGGWRIAAVGAVFAAAFAAAGVRAVTLTVAPGGTETVAAAPRDRAAPVTTERADLVDRNGEILASTLMSHSLYADPSQVWDPRETAEALARVLPDLDVAAVEARLSSRRRFVWIKRTLSPRQRQAVFDLGLPGLGFRTEAARVYPRGRLAAHALGFTDVDGRGKAGAERAFEAELTAGDGRMFHLALDLRAQYALHEELAEAAERHRAKAAVGLVTDVNSGEILALVSLPDFDPNAPASASESARTNRAMARVYELGSVAKTFTFAMAVDLGIGDPDRPLPVHEPLQAGGAAIADPYPSATALTVREAYVKSSNVGAALLALEAGEAAQRDYWGRFGLLDRAPLGYVESAAPLSAEEWTETRRATMAYGHGLAVSPAAFIAGFGASVNGGWYVKPTLRPVGARGAARERVIAERTSLAMRALMRAVVVDGTGRRADVPGYQVGGKTGTAEKFIDGAYDEDRLISAFAAVFPIERPRYAVFIMFDEPEGEAGRPGAGHTAAPTAARVIARVAPVLGVPGDAAVLAAQRDGAW